MRFAGRRVIVTGGAGGLGSVMAAAFASEGARVALVDLPGSRGREVADGINAAGAAGSAGAAGNASFTACDLADLAGTRLVMEEIAARPGGVDVLVNNAAIYPSKAVADYTIDEWQLVQRTNVDAAFVSAQAVLPAMRAAGSGRIVNISSITFFGGLSLLAPYVTSKGALVGLTRALARECGADGITVNAIAPGAFPTAAEAIHPDPEAYNAFVLDQQAVKRRGRAQDVANAVLFFSAPESSFITGQLLCVDGGWVMH
ncbi:MAG: SDR family NAD(P)-dependent oxidoreductase [Micromonosporaceae bacterium]